MNRLKFYYLLFIAVLFFTACSKDGDASLNSPENQLAKETITVLRSSNAVSKRENFRQFVFSFLQDFNILSQEEYWGQTGFSVEVFKNYQVTVPNYSATTTDLHYGEGVTKCN